MAEAALVVTWVETLKVRLISDQRKKSPQYRGLVHAASSILRQEVSNGSACEVFVTYFCAGNLWSI